MTTINDKFNQLGTSIINLVSTRASKNLDNLSEVGLNNLVAIADAATSEAMSDYVPTSRTINGKSLSSDITLTASNVGAASSSHTHSNYVSTSSLSEVQCVVETYQNGDSWYRVWSDGWCEQGGRVTSTATSGTVTMIKSFASTNYTLVCQEGSSSDYAGTDTDTGGYGDNLGITDGTVNSFRYSIASERYFNWYACGYLYY